MALPRRFIARRNLSHVVAPMRHSTAKSLRKDILLLLLGAAIGLGSALITAHVQAQAEIRKQVFEKRFTVLREVVAFHNEASFKLNTSAVEIEAGLNESLEILNRWLDPLGARQPSKDELVSALRQSRLAVTKITAAHSKEMNEYFSKLETHMTMLSAAFGQAPQDLRIEINQDYAGKQQAAMNRFSKSVDGVSNLKPIVEAARILLHEVIKLTRERQDIYAKEWERVNERLRFFVAKLGVSIE